MAKIILKGVNIEAIEIDGIENPQELLQALGASKVERKKEEPKKEKVIEPEPVATQVDKPKKKRAARKVAKEKKPAKKLIDILEPGPQQFEHARRMRDVMAVFADAGIEDVNRVVEICERVKDEVPFLSRVLDIPTRIPVAWARYREEMRA